MLPYSNHLVVYAKQYYAFFDAPEYTELVPPPRFPIVRPGSSSRDIKNPPHCLNHRSA